MRSNAIEVVSAKAKSSPDADAKIVEGNLPLSAPTFKEAPSALYSAFGYELPLILPTIRVCP
jgi:hypothetical protein